MIIIRLFIMTLMLTAFLTSCNSNNASINNPPTNNIDTLGNIYGHIQSTDGPVKDAYVTLDNSSTFADINGNFSFYNCSKKTSLLSIYHPEFEAYSNTVIIIDSLNLIIPLLRLKYDYFPLSVGNHWQYYYLYYGYTPAGSFYQPKIVDLEVLSKSGNYPNYIFNFKQTLFDSTDNSTTTSYFNINTSKSDSITFLGNNILIGDNITITRYFILTSDEIIIQNDKQFKRSIGLWGFNYGWNGNQSGWNWKCELLDYTLF